MKYLVVLFTVSLFAINDSFIPQDTAKGIQPIKATSAAAPKPKRTVPPRAPSSRRFNPNTARPKVKTTNTH